MSKYQNGQTPSIEHQRIPKKEVGFWAVGVLGVGAGWQRTGVSLCVIACLLGAFEPNAISTLIRFPQPFRPFDSSSFRVLARVKCNSKCQLKILFLSTIGWIGKEIPLNGFHLAKEKIGYREREMG